LRDKMNLRISGIRRSEAGLAFERGAAREFLPHRGRMLLVDRVLSLAVEARYLVAEKAVAQNEAAMEGQGAVAAAFPQALLIESMAQACGFLMNVCQFLRINGLAAEDLLDPATERRTVRFPPLSVLGESKITQRGLARPGEEIRIEARALAVRGDVWCFAARARSRGELAHGEIILAYPPYVQGRPTRRPEIGAAAAGA
jgi:3-hydroxymyristoyl/3-hydroxydecanoyl-(acyl carrier protein) dehydratase